MAFYPNDYIKPDRKIKKLKADGKTPEEISEIQLNDRGIIDKNNRYDISAAVFVRYAMTRIAVHQKEEEFWFYNFKTKHYDLLSDSRIRKTFLRYSAKLMRMYRMQAWRNSISTFSDALFQNLHALDMRPVFCNSPMEFLIFLIMNSYFIDLHLISFVSFVFRMLLMRMLNVRSS